MFEAVAQAIRDHDTIIIHRHNRPDGDALGSQVGLKHLILDNFPGKQVWAVGDESNYLDFLSQGQLDTVEDETYQGALAIILDSGAKSLISDDRYSLAKTTVRLDHHIFVEKIADIEVIDTSFESCCGMVTQLALEQGLTLSPISARALYTGMVTDSGRFRYDCTTDRTFTLASALMKQNFDTNDLYRRLYADDISVKKLKAQFILKIQFTANRVAWIYTTREEVGELSADIFTISRGMVNTMADLRGTDIWVNFTETDRGVLCEIRSNDKNINPIAVAYGGGGHKKASGATVADRETAMAMLRDLDKLAGENQ